MMPHALLWFWLGGSIAARGVLDRPQFQIDLLHTDGIRIEGLLGINGAVRAVRAVIARFFGHRVVIRYGFRPTAERGRPCLSARWPPRFWLRARSAAAPDRPSRPRRA